MSVTGELQIKLYRQYIKFIVLLRRKYHVPTFSVFKLWALNRKVKKFHVSQDWYQVSLENIKQFGSRWMDFHEIWYLSVIRKFVWKIWLSLKSDKNDRYFTWRPVYIFSSILLNSFKMKNISDKLAEKSKAYIFV